MRIGVEDFIVSAVHHTPGAAEPSAQAPPQRHGRAVDHTRCQGPRFGHPYRDRCHIALNSRPSYCKVWTGLTTRNFTAQLWWLSSRLPTVGKSTSDVPSPLRAKEAAFSAENCTKRFSGAPMPQDPAMRILPNTPTPKADTSLPAATTASLDGRSGAIPAGHIRCVRSVQLAAIDLP